MVRSDSTDAVSRSSIGTVRGVESGSDNLTVTKEFVGDTNSPSRSPGDEAIVLSKSSCSVRFDERRRLLVSGMAIPSGACSSGD